MTQHQIQLAEMPVPAFLPLLSDSDIAAILGMTTDWVRSHSDKIPGFQRLGSYFRFCSASAEQWLGSLDPLFQVERVAELLKVPESWVYANADEIPGVLRMGRYVRFRPATILCFLSGSEVVQ